MTGGLVRGLHRILVGQGWVGASEFWSLAPVQAWWIIEDRMPAEAFEAHEAKAEMLRMLREAKRNEVARTEVQDRG